MTYLTDAPSADRRITLTPAAHAYALAYNQVNLDGIFQESDLSGLINFLLIDHKRLSRVSVGSAFTSDEPSQDAPITPSSSLDSLDDLLDGV